MKVAIIGVTGYSGLELIRLLSQHPEVEIQSLHSQSMINHKISDIYPHLKNSCELMIKEIDSEVIMNETDLVFLGTPSGVSATLGQPFIEANFPLIDLSGDFRLKTEGAYEKWYGKASAPLESIHQAEYGLAEERQQPQVKLIANPGCYATGALLSLAPLVKEELVQEDSLIIDGKSGLSGAGKVPSPSSHAVSVMENMTVYKMNQHQHTPEILQQLQQWNSEIEAIQFTTSLIPVTRGILLTIYAKAKKEVSETELFNLFETYYQEKPFVRIQPIGMYPDLKQVQGSNYCDIGLAYNPGTRLITIVCTLDNLVKGAAGQAIQNLNIMWGFPEEMGLLNSPVFP